MAPPFDPGASSPSPVSVGYVGNLVGRYVIGSWGSGLVLSLAALPRVKSVDVFCPQLDSGLTRDPIRYPSPVHILESYDLDRPLSVLGLWSRLRRWHGELLVFSMNTTSFGIRSSTNFLGLLTPLVARLIMRKPVALVYHSSVLTSDIEKLGYSSGFDRLRALIAGAVERRLFRNVPTWVLLKCYKQRVDGALGEERTHVFRNEYLEAVPTIVLNGYDSTEEALVVRHEGRQVPRLLLHGFWGPQKDLDGVLQVLENLAADGSEFYLTISGTVNPHFPAYAAHLDELCTIHRKIIASRLGAVSEAAIGGLMTGNDVILLPYNVSGGQSGVLEIASCFEVPAIVRDFPEYREKAETKPTVVLIDSKGMAEAIRQAIARLRSIPDRRVDTARKIAIAQSYVQAFLEDALQAV